MIDFFPLMGESVKHIVVNCVIFPAPVPPFPPTPHPPANMNLSWVITIYPIDLGVRQREVLTLQTLHAMWNEYMILIVLLNNVETDNNGCS
jgi:hypothetical protein